MPAPDYASYLRNYMNQMQRNNSNPALRTQGGAFGGPLVHSYWSDGYARQLADDAYQRALMQWQLEQDDARQQEAMDLQRQGLEQQMALQKLNTAGQLASARMGMMGGMMGNMMGGLTNMFGGMFGGMNPWQSAFR